MTARNVEQLSAAAEAFFMHVANGEQALAMGMIHPSVRGELPWETIAATWNRCLTEHGALERFSDTYVTHPGGSTPIDDLAALSDQKMLGIAVAATTLRQEAGEVMGRIAFDQDDAIVGILYLPADTPQQSLPF